MSDETPAAAPTAPLPPAAKPSKGVLGLLVLNLAGTGLVAFKVMTAHPAEAAAHHEEPEAEAGSLVTGPVVALDPFVVNLDEPGTSRYLKVTLEVEMIPKEGEVLVTKSKQLIRDTILSHLSGLHVKDTLGADAKEKIRTDLLAKLTKLMGPEKVRRLFFQEFVVQ
jgi:flagellar FliL protein